MRSSQVNRDSLTDAPGQDSFLDIVANIVGILIIFIMVLGVRARDVMVHASQQTSSTSSQTVLTKTVATFKKSEQELSQLTHDLKQQTEEQQILKKQVQQVQSTGKAEQQGVEQLKQEIAKHHHLIQVNKRLYQQRDLDRQHLMRTIVLAEEKISRQEQERGGQALLTKQIIDAQAKFKELKQQELGFQTSSRPSVGKLVHLPTPLAKTVFHREISFRLLGGQLTYVPWEELTEQIKRDFPKKMARLRSAPQVTETVGPVAGFFARYVLTTKQIRQQGQFGDVGRTIVYVANVELVPTSRHLGEPLQTALEPHSQFSRYLKNRDPNRTPITIWTYTDSFEDFRQLKLTLFKRGFAVAGRPIRMGRLISGGPDGTRSAVQ